MLVIRLQRTGRKNNPTYRLAVAEKSNAVGGKSIEIIGHYLPSRNPSVFEFNKDRVSYWIKNGASPSDTVARLLTNNGMKELEKFMKRYTKKRSKKAPEEPVIETKKAVPTIKEEEKKEKSVENTETESSSKTKKEEKKEETKTEPQNSDTKNYETNKSEEIGAKDGNSETSKENSDTEEEKA